MKRKQTALAIAMALSALASAHAQQTLTPITVTATRTSAQTDSVAATVTAIERQAIDVRLPSDVADLFKDEPDVALARDLRRFGATRINVRGIEDNRVAQLVDGVRLPDFYNSGGPTNFTMSAPLGASLDFIKRAEIVRGPASSLYGSDAIGGVVGYLTLDPADLLGRDKRWALRYRLGHTGANDGRTHSLLGAWRAGAIEALLGYARTDAKQFDNFGSADIVGPARTAPNPQDIADRGMLAKLIVRPAAGHRFTFVVEGRERDDDTEVRRLPGALPKVSAMAGQDQSRRVRAGVEWEHMGTGLFYDRLTARLSRQQTETANQNRQIRSNTSASCSAASGAGSNCLVAQSFAFSQDADSAGVQFESGLGLGGVEHIMTWGLDASRVTSGALRDATISNLSTGTTSKSLAGDTFPLRDFATGRTETLGLFLQDEFALGTVSVTPGLRYDRRALKPQVDALAQQVLAGIGRSASDKTDSAMSPKLALMWRVGPPLSLYGQVARGFRAPNYEEVNGAFRNLVQRYGSSPNPGLEPETSTSVEAGVKWHTAQLRGQFAAYDNRYRDFIENARLNCPADPRCLPVLATTFMYMNRAQARIRGVDLRTTWYAAPGWRADGAIAHARGESEPGGQALNTVEPLRASLGLTRESASWGAEARLRLARRVTRSNDSGEAWFRPPGYGVADMAAWWRPVRGATLNAAVNNVFDKKHWLWSDIRQADARHPAGVDFYSQPGRKLSLSATFDL